MVMQANHFHTAPIIKVAIDSLKGEHAVSALNPITSASDYAELKTSLLDNGQRETIKLYRGLIVDGRHRVKALKELSQETVLAQEFPHKATKEDLMTVVRISDARRSKTPTQKAIQAYRMAKSEGITLDAAAEKYGVSSRNVKHVSAIAKMTDAAGTQLEALFNGEAHVKLDGSATVSLSKIEEDLKLRKNGLTVSIVDTKLPSNNAAYTVAKPMAELIQAMFSAQTPEVIALVKKQLGLDMQQVRASFAADSRIAGVLVNIESFLGVYVRVTGATTVDFSSIREYMTEQAKSDASDEDIYKALALGCDDLWTVDLIKKTVSKTGHQLKHNPVFAFFADVAKFGKAEPK